MVVAAFTDPRYVAGLAFYMAWVGLLVPVAWPALFAMPTGWRQLQLFPIVALAGQLVASRHGVSEDWSVAGAWILALLATLPWLAARVLCDCRSLAGTAAIYAAMAAQGTAAALYIALYNKLTSWFDEVALLLVVLAVYAVVAYATRERSEASYWVLVVFWAFESTYLGWVCAVGIACMTGCVPEDLAAHDASPGVYVGVASLAAARLVAAFKRFDRRAFMSVVSRSEYERT